MRMQAIANVRLAIWKGLVSGNLKAGYQLLLKFLKSPIFWCGLLYHYIGNCDYYIGPGGFCDHCIGPGGFCDHYIVDN